jgi:hypothetical protein
VKSKRNIRYFQEIGLLAIRPAGAVETATILLMRAIFKGWAKNETSKVGVCISQFGCGAVACWLRRHN